MYEGLTADELALYVDDIRRIDIENATCKGCDGICRKDTAKGYRLAYRVEGHGLEMYAVMCEQEARNRSEEELQKLMKSAKVPGSYRVKNFHDFNIRDNNRDAVYLVQALLRGELMQGNKYGEEREGLLLYGEPRCGKTFLASIYANERLKRGEKVLFIDVPSLMDELRTSVGNGGNEGHEKLELAKNASILILDDLGAENMTEWAAQQLFLIINHRVANALPMLVTSNCTPEELVLSLSPMNKATGERDLMMGKRLGGRILETCYPCPMGW